MLKYSNNLLSVGIAARGHLSGMQIKGDGHLIYNDPHPKIIWCYSYPPEGTYVCSDVIRIPLNGTSVRTLSISTDVYLILCEVQVFGGTEYIYSFPPDLSIFSIFFL